MRLWHQALIPYLDTKRLLGQHRECCALRGKGWGRKHATVDYVFKYDLAHLYAYHLLVMDEIADRFNNYDNLESQWFNRLYRGKNMQMASVVQAGAWVHDKDTIIYPEHDDKYLKDCLLNLKSKGAELTNGKTIEQMLIELDLKDV